MKINIIIGLSGSGKSTAIHVFEDMDMLTADGVPPLMLPELARVLIAGRETPCDIAIGVRQNTPHLAEELTTAMSKLKVLDMEPSLLFLSCTPSEIMRRYATTRRPHPLERKGVGLEQAIAEEISELEAVHSMADTVINTTHYSLHDLRRELQRRLESASTEIHGMKVNIISFGFKYGVPREADLMFDMRFLPNPYFIEKLRPLTGLNPAVSESVFSTESALTFRQKFIDFIREILPLYDAEGRYRLTVAIGCTGGRHRSVAAAEALAEALRLDAFTVSVEHRHMNLG